MVKIRKIFFVFSLYFGARFERGWCDLEDVERRKLIFAKCLFSGRKRKGTKSEFPGREEPETELVNFGQRIFPEIQLGRKSTSETLPVCIYTIPN